MDGLLLTYEIKQHLGPPASNFNVDVWSSGSSRGILSKTGIVASTLKLGTGVVLREAEVLLNFVRQPSGHRVFPIADITKRQIVRFRFSSCVRRDWRSVKRLERLETRWGNESSERWRAPWWAQRGRGKRTGCGRVKREGRGGGGS